VVRFLVVVRRKADHDLLRFQDADHLYDIALPASFNPAQGLLLRGITVRFNRF
jgi:hypothetical protein